MSWNVKYVVLIAFSSVVTYLAGILIDFIGNCTEKDGGKGKRSCILYSFIKIFSCKSILILCLAINLSILFIFKYANFIFDSITTGASYMGIKAEIPTFDIVLPVGISFYTFQALSYTIDVYRGEVRAERNLFKYALFVSFFPQLVAGPIERTKNLLTQIQVEHRFEYDKVSRGMLLMLWGFFEKLLISDRVAIVVNDIFKNYGQCSRATIVLGLVLFAVQIYCDFGGYSDIARGAAMILGFDLMKNFDCPYFARSIKEFWRRWHISLSSWFRDYVYIPLGGNRCSQLRRNGNLMLTFLLSGLWHGADWKFVAWGGLHGFYQIAGESLSPVRKKIQQICHINTECFSWKLLQALVTFALVAFAWIFFRANSFFDALKMIEQFLIPSDGSYGIIATLNNVGFSDGDQFFLFVAICVLFAFDAVRKRWNVLAFMERQNLWFRYCVYGVAFFAVFLACIFYSNVAAQQFIYFQF